MTQGEWIWALLGGLLGFVTGATGAIPLIDKLIEFELLSVYRSWQLVLMGLAGLLGAAGGALGTVAIVRSLRDD